MPRLTNLRLADVFGVHRERCSTGRLGSAARRGRRVELSPIVAPAPRPLLARPVGDGDEQVPGVADRDDQQQDDDCQQEAQRQSLLVAGQE